MDLLKNDRQGSMWVETSSCDVEVQLAHGDTHSATSEITCGQLKVCIIHNRMGATSTIRLDTYQDREYVIRQ
jgi:hypothetical protein